MGCLTSRLLTIIVPTFNRRESLTRGLSALIPQIEAHCDDVALYVSDNCSDDDTQELVCELQGKHPGIIQYKRQERNLGAQGNFKDAVLSVGSKFVAIFSDDDIALPCYIEMILEQLQEHPDLGLINYNALCVSSSGRYIGVRDPLVTYGHPRYYDVGGEFIKEHTHVPSLVSSNVFDREAFIASREHLSDDVYPGYTWYAALLRCIIDKPCCYIDSPLFVANSPAINRWEDKALRYYVSGLGRLFKDLDSVNPGIWKAWQTEFESGWMLRTCLCLASKYRKEYANNKAELLQYSTSTYVRKQLDLHLRYPGELLRVTHQIRRAVYWMRRKFN